MRRYALLVVLGAFARSLASASAAAAVTLSVTAPDAPRRRTARRTVLAVLAAAAAWLLIGIADARAAAPEGWTGSIEITAKFANSNEVDSSRGSMMATYKRAGSSRSRRTRCHPAAIAARSPSPSSRP
jgi:hypothetical protein